MPRDPLSAVRPIKVQSIAEHVVEQLEKLIETEVLATGDRLPSEAELADALQVGRSTVREAKQILTAKGLLVSRGRAGSFVASARERDEVTEVLRALRHPSHEDVIHVRRILEIEAVRVASERATAEQIAAMRAAMAAIEIQTIEQKTAAWARNLDIHRLIVQATGNAVLAGLYELVAQTLLRTQVPFLPYIADWSEEVASHHRLIDVVAAGDPDAAAAEMAAHLQNSDKYRHDLLEVEPAEVLRWREAAHIISRGASAPSPKVLPPLEKDSDD